MLFASHKVVYYDYKSLLIQLFVFLTVNLFLLLIKRKAIKIFFQYSQTLNNFSVLSITTTPLPGTLSWNP